jgi:CRP/FNR family transcriptional regulator, cyclic AMP receptor protein
MARDRYLDHLAQIPLFSHCSKKDLRLVSRQLTELDIDEGAVLLSEGERATYFLVVVEGSLAVRRNGRKVATLGPGEVVGEMALLMDRPRTATVSAAEPSKVLVGERRSFEALLDEVPGLAKKVLKSLAHRVADNERAMVH